MDPKIDGKPISLWESIKVEKDQVLEVQELQLILQPSLLVSCLVDLTDTEQ